MTRDWTFAGCAGGSTRRDSRHHYLDRPLDGSQLEDEDDEDNEDNDDRRQTADDWITA